MAEFVIENTDLRWIVNEYNVVLGFVTPQGNRHYFAKDSAPRALDTDAIIGGSIDNTPVGAATPSTGKFTSLESTGAATLASVSSAAATFTGGAIDNIPIGGTTAATGKFTSVDATSVTSTGKVLGAISDTAIATVGNGTLTAAALVGGIVTRSGPTAAYTDTTDTAANIIAALANPEVGASFEINIKNTVAFAQTIAAGAGVTLAGTTDVAASSVRKYVLTIDNVAAPAVTLRGVSQSSL